MHGWKHVPQEMLDCWVSMHNTVHSSPRPWQLHAPATHATPGPHPRQPNGWPEQAALMHAPPAGHALLQTPQCASLAANNTQVPSQSERGGGQLAVPPPTHVLVDTSHVITPGQRPSASQGNAWGDSFWGTVGNSTHAPAANHATNTQPATTVHGNPPNLDGMPALVVPRLGAVTAWDNATPARRATRWGL